MLQKHGALGQAGGSYAHFSIFMVQGRVDALGLSHARLGKLGRLARDEGHQFHLAAGMRSRIDAPIGSRGS